MQSFDRDSGVVYTETTSASVRSMVPTWMSQARGKRDLKTNLKNRGKGCSSLQEMALGSCAWNAELFVPETLQWAGWHYASRIYQHLLNTEALTFNAWNIFFDAYPDEINPQHEFHVYQQDEWSVEPTQLPSIINRLAKLDMSLVTLLCVRDFSLTFDHLKALIAIPTLAALTLEQSRRGGMSEISARNFRDWCRVVREMNALRKLSLIVLCDFGLGRNAVLTEVSCFPSLNLLGVQNSKTWSISGELSHESGGWQLMTSSGLQQQGLSSTHWDPQSIWGASYLTTSRKVQRLYDLTKVIAQPANSLTKNDRSICITYGGWTNRSIHEATSWFIRNIQKPKLKPSLPASNPALGGSARSVSKKRKVRSGKQIDVGSLLGAFD